MVLVDDRRALGQLAQVADDRFRLAPGAARASRLGGALGEQLALGEDDELRVVDGEAVFQGRDGQRESRFVASGSFAGTTADERREIRHHLRPQLRRLQR